MQQHEFNWGPNQKLRIFEVSWRNESDKRTKTKHRVSSDDGFKNCDQVAFAFMNQLGLKECEVKEI